MFFGPPLVAMSNLSEGAVESANTGTNVLSVGLGSTALAILSLADMKDLSAIAVAATTILCLLYTNFVAPVLRERKKRKEKDQTLWKETPSAE